MPIIKNLRNRSVEAEYMDDLSTGGAELIEALQHLRRLNRIFAAAKPSLYGIDRLWRMAGRPSRLSLLDIGSGSGDVNVKILHWAEQRGIRISMTLMDITVEACQEAKKLFASDKRVEVVQGDMYQLPETYADIIVSSQFLHHFSNEEVPEVVKHLLRASQIGVIINDIHRHLIPWAAVWFTARVISRNRYIRHDGPLSVAKGFRSSDWKELRSVLNLTTDTELFYRWQPLFRYAVVIPKSGETKRAFAMDTHNRGLKE